MKKLALGAAALLVFTGALPLLSFAGCDSDKRNATPHIHVYNESKWETDENYHFYASVCGHAVVKSFAHVYDDDSDSTCNVCMYRRTVEDGAEQQPSLPEQPAEPNNPETPSPEIPENPDQTETPELPENPDQTETPELQDHTDPTHRAE